MNGKNIELWPGWETVRVIGRGSFGTVYEIERDIFGQKEKAALKVITIPQNSSDIDELRGDGYDDASITDTFKSYLKKIIDEYSVMRKLNGTANVVNCDDVKYTQHDDGFGWEIYIKMELLTPLKKALGTTVSEEQVIQIGKDICKALVLCRKHNIVHRDIKPDNIFLSENGDYKLGDFGIAKTVEKTSGGTKIGTYEYMAPEVYHDEPYGHSADIYSLGLVLYWLLNERRMPFMPLPPKLPEISDKDEARKKRFSGEPIPAPAHGSKELKQIVLKACAFSPEDRHKSSEEFYQALCEIGARYENSFSSESENTETAGAYKSTEAPKEQKQRGEENDRIDEGSETEGVFRSKRKEDEVNSNSPKSSPSKKLWIILSAVIVVSIIAVISLRPHGKTINMSVTQTTSPKQSQTVDPTQMLAETSASTSNAEELYATAEKYYLGDGVNQDYATAFE